MKSYIKRVGVAGLAATLTGTLLASAQSPPDQSPVGGPSGGTAAPPRAYRPVFRGADENTSARQTLDLSASLAEAYDQNLLADGGGNIAPGAIERSGYYTALTGQAALRLNGHRFDFQAGGGTNLRYYGDLHRMVGTNQVADVGMSGRFGRRGGFSVNQSVTTAPSYLHGLFGAAAGSPPGALVTASDDYVLRDTSAYTYTTTTALTEGLSRRGSLSLSSNVRHTDFGVNTAGLRDLSAYDVGGHFGYAWTRDATLRIGYVFRQGQSAEAQRHTAHGIDVGIDYIRPLSATRRTTVSITTGSLIVTAPLPTGSFDQTPRHQYRFVGDLALRHQMSRTWAASANYHRGLEFVAGLSGPLYTDAFSVTTQGFLGRRVDVRGSGAYSAGNGALPGSPAQFSTYTGQARVRYGLSRNWAVYTEYLYYLYRFNRALQIPAGVPPRLERNGARVGLMLMIPLRHR